MGKAEIKRQGEKVAILAFGTMVYPALAAAEELNATVVNMRFVKPLDTDVIDQLLNEHDVIVTIEENAIKGGAGSGINEYLHSIKNNTPVINLGLPDKFLDHGNHQQMLSACGLDTQGIIDTVKTHFQA